jgi:ankyrin repeat protein
MRNIEALQALLDRGAAPNPAAEGHTPRSLAEGRGNGEIVAILNKYISPAS